MAKGPNDPEWRVRKQRIDPVLDSLGWPRVHAATLHAEKLVKATLAKAFRGELVPTEAELAQQEGREYETAEALLARIRQRRHETRNGTAPRERRRRTSHMSSYNPAFDESLFDHAAPASGSESPERATTASDATFGLSEGSIVCQNGSGEDWVDISYDEAMSYVREAFTKGGARDREQAIKDVATALGFQRVGLRVGAEVDGYLRAAVRRGILKSENGSYSLLVRNAGDYTRDHLIEMLMASVDGSWMEREEAVRAIAKHLGFQRAGTAFKEALKSAINGAIRRGLLVYAGDRVRKA
jgi:hypothetical protein